MSETDLTNQQFNSWTVLYFIGRKNSKKYWMCRCNCGTEKPVEEFTLIHGKSKTCGCSRKGTAIKDLRGQKFGKLTVIEPTNRRVQRRVVWKCLCDCGNESEVLAAHLYDGHTTSCGKCKEVQDLTGLKSGYLTVVGFDRKDNKRSYWKCKCKCGNEVSVRGDHLQAKHTISCGCVLSKGEYKIIQLLLENNIQFKQQKTFSACKFPDSDWYAKFDFFVNNSYCIEYDGEDHFQPVKRSYNITDEQALECFRKKQIKDNFKNEWCKNNNIPLIRIPYTHFNDIKIEDLKLETSQFIIK